MPVFHLVPEILKVSFVSLGELSPEVQQQAEWIFGDLIGAIFERWSDGVLVPAFVYDYGIAEFCERFNDLIKGAVWASEEDVEREAVSLWMMMVKLRRERWPRIRIWDGSDRRFLDITEEL